MITFERTADIAIIKGIVTNPRVYPAVSDDGAPPAEQWEPIQHDAAWYVLAKDGGEILGMWIFFKHNHICWQVHTCLLPSAWGERARDAVRALAAWVWSNMPCLRVITEVPRYNKQALRFAHVAGMVEYGINPKAYMKSGTLHDIILLGISKPGAN